MSILARDAGIAARTAGAAVAGLHRQWRYQEAADLGRAAVDLLESAGLSASVDLLLAGLYSCVRRCPKS